MKNRIFSTFPILCVLTTFIMLLSSSGIALAEQDKVAIDKVRLDFNAAFNDGKAEAMGQLIDLKSVWLPPGKQALVGKDKIVQHYADYFAQVHSEFELQAGDIQVSDGWAFMSGAFSRADTLKAGGKATQAFGHYLFVLKKQSDGTWKIARDIWNETVKP
jgi:ketosteroid isomerase-like protein